MNGSYTDVARALNEGADPALLCGTCPWNRPCFHPPSATRSEVAKKTAPPEIPAGTPAAEASQAFTDSLVALLLYSGRDRLLDACPVLAAEAGGPGGGDLHGVVRAHMQRTVRAEASR